MFSHCERSEAIQRFKGTGLLRCARNDGLFRVSFFLKVLAPWFSVMLFWCVFENAWLALLGYHLQIVLWDRQILRRVCSGFTIKGLVLFVLPTLIAGPAMYLLLPYLIEGSLSEWLARYGLSGWALVLMIPYFGLFTRCLNKLTGHHCGKKAHWRIYCLPGITCWYYSLYCQRPG